MAVVCVRLSRYFGITGQADMGAADWREMPS